ncbi:MAG: response regulator [Planctomycetes bacterium]|nr:response regulator [Planctomycetota bacterium]
MRKRILFIDDDVNTLEGLRWMLRPETELWDMHFAATAEEAWDLIGKIEFDTIVLDYYLPGTDGFSFLERLQDTDQTRDIPVVIVTGCPEEGMKRQALELGAADLLSKPFVCEDLLARLHNILRLKDYQDELKYQKLTLEDQVRQRTAELEESRLDIILRLGKAAEYRDEETGNHILRVGCYCRTLAEDMGMSRDFAEMVFMTSPMHDIGKIGIPDWILLKPGKLTPEERREMERHCRIGHDILIEEPDGLKPFLQWHRNREVVEQKNPLLGMAGEIALGHHERWDGKGYPNKLAGEDIPIAARMAALADVYDALRSERPYKNGFSQEKTLAIIREEEGGHFDPEILAAFDQVKEIFNDIREQLSDEPLEEKILQR